MFAELDKFHYTLRKTREKPLRSFFCCVFYGHKLKVRDILPPLKGPGNTYPAFQRSSLNFHFGQVLPFQVGHLQLYSFGSPYHKIPTYRIRSRAFFISHQKFCIHYHVFLYSTLDTFPHHILDMKT
jgi:hypothetical protein